MTENAAEMIKAFHENVDDVLAAQEPARRKKDKARLREIRGLMAKSPLGKELLNWADSNGIRIEMDHQTKAGGYYCPGYKIVALNATSDNLTLVGTLAHEIRHAWQDSHGMIPSLSDKSAQLQTPEDYITQIKFIEADAFAVGESVRRSVSRLEGRRRNVWAYNSDLAPRKKPVKNEEAPESLAQRFTQFFNDVWPRNFYEDRCLKTYAKIIGVSDIEIPCGSGEYFNEKTEAAIHQNGLELRNPQRIHLLGDMLGKGNYMEHLPEGMSTIPLYRSLQLIQRIREVEQRPPYADMKDMNTVSFYRFWQIKQQIREGGSKQKRSLYEEFKAMTCPEKTLKSKKQTMQNNSNLLYVYVTRLRKQHRMG